MGKKLNFIMAAAVIFNMSSEQVQTIKTKSLLPLPRIHYINNKLWNILYTAFLIFIECKTVYQYAEDYLLV